MHHGSISLKNWTWRNRNFFGADSSSRVSRMLVVRRWRAIDSASIHQMSKVEDGTSGPEKGFAQDGDSMAEATGKEVFS